MKIVRHMKVALYFAVDVAKRMGSYIATATGARLFGSASKQLAIYAIRIIGSAFVMTRTWLSSEVWDDDIKEPIKHAEKTMSKENGKRMKMDAEAIYVLNDDDTIHYKISKKDIFFVPDNVESGQYMQEHEEEFMKHCLETYERIIFEQDVEDIDLLYIDGHVFNITYEVLVEEGIDEFYDNIVNLEMYEYADRAKAIVEEVNRIRHERA